MAANPYVLRKSITANLRAAGFVTDVRVSDMWLAVSKTLVNVFSADDHGYPWYQGVGAPSPTVGMSGDTYVDVSTGDVYNKSGGGWSPSLFQVLVGGTTGTGAVVRQISPTMRSIVGETTHLLTIQALDTNLQLFGGSGADAGDVEIRAGVNGSAVRGNINIGNANFTEADFAALKTQSGISLTSTGTGSLVRQISPTMRSIVGETTHLLTIQALDTNLQLFGGSGVDAGDVEIRAGVNGSAVRGNINIGNVNFTEANFAALKALLTDHTLKVVWVEKTYADFQAVPGHASSFSAIDISAIVPVGVTSIVSARAILIEQFTSSGVSPGGAVYVGGSDAVYTASRLSNLSNIFSVGIGTDSHMGSGDPRDQTVADLRVSINLSGDATVDNLTAGKVLVQVTCC